MIIKVTDRSQVKPFFETLSRIVYGAFATILLLLTLVLAGDAVFQFFRVAVVGGELTEAALSGIGYVVVSVATFEIARYLTERGVMRRREIQLASCSSEDFSAAHGAYLTGVDAADRAIAVRRKSWIAPL